MINVENLQFTYPGNQSATIQDVSFTVQQGEIFGLLGPSGAGKSTLQKIIMGVLKNYKGSVRVNEVEVKGITSHFYENLGVAFEHPNFYQKFTAEENLQFFSSFYDGKEKNDLKLLMERLGLSDNLRTRVSDYSKGMKMRLNLCRALLHRPQFILLDEPTSGLDPVNVKKVKELILEEKETGKTILLNTHNMHIAQSLCDRVAFIVDGKIVLIDSPENLMDEQEEKKVEVIYREGEERKKKTFLLKGLSKNKEFQTLLDREVCESIRTDEKTLEDHFIEVTGRKLSDVT